MRVVPIAYRRTRCRPPGAKGSRSRAAQSSAGATFRGVLLGDADMRWLVASNAGYGFFVRLAELYSRNRAGKACLRVPEGGDV